MTEDPPESAEESPDDTEANPPDESPTTPTAEPSTEQSADGSDDRLDDDPETGSDASEHPSGAGPIEPAEGADDAGVAAVDPTDDEPQPDDVGDESAAVDAPGDRSTDAPAETVDEDDLDEPLPDEAAIEDDEGDDEAGPAPGPTTGTDGLTATAGPHEADTEEPPGQLASPTASDVGGDDEDATADEAAGEEGAVPPDVRKYERFKKMDGAEYERVNEFLRDRTYITAREWAIARLCADFRTETGVEMTKIGENLPELVPFMTDTYSPQAVNQARASFEEKVRKAGATFLYGAMCNFFTAEELDEVMYEVTEVAKFLLEVEGVDLSVEEELEAEDRISGIMREVRMASEALRYDECPHCGEQLREPASHD